MSSLMQNCFTNVSVNLSDLYIKIPLQYTHLSLPKLCSTTNKNTIVMCTCT